MIWASTPSGRHHQRGRALHLADRWPVHRLPRRHRRGRRQPAAAPGRTFDPQSVGRLVRPPPNAATSPQSAVDKLCDHVSMARAEAERAGETTLFACLDLVLSILFTRLGLAVPGMH